jgi:hypothetical protein
MAPSSTLTIDRGLILVYTQISLTGKLATPIVPHPGGTGVNRKSVLHRMMRRRKDSKMRQDWYGWLSTDANPNPPLSNTTSATAVITTVTAGVEHGIYILVGRIVAAMAATDGEDYKTC